MDEYSGVCVFTLFPLFILDTDFPFPSTRLETRTKECNVYASVWVFKPLRIVKAILAVISMLRRSHAFDASGI